MQIRVCCYDAAWRVFEFKDYEYKYKREMRRLTCPAMTLSHSLLAKERIGRSDALDVCECTGQEKRKGPTLERGRSDFVSEGQITS